MNPEVDVAYDLVQQFTPDAPHTRTGERFERLAAQGRTAAIFPNSSPLPTSIEKDKGAVKLVLSWWINNGMVKNHVTKLTLIKRQGYGRAGFPLLPQPLLHTL